MDFKKLKAWQRAHALALDLHRSSRDFARRGHANLRSQLTRAGDSVPANTVEGCGAASRREFARFLDIALKSATEVEYHLLSAKDLGLLSRTDWSRYTAEIMEIRKMLYVYRKRILETNGLIERL